MSTGTTIPSFKRTATNGDGGDFELPPAGIHPAVVVAIVDLGTHESNYNGKVGERHKILLVWELTAEADSKGVNFLISQDYTWSLNAKAALRDVVKGFRGRDLADGEEYELADMLGKPCMVSLSEGLSAKGKKFMEVTGISPPMKGMKVPPPTYPAYAFSLEGINSTLDPIDIPEWMPRLYGRYVIDDIKASKEYGRLPGF